MMSINEKCYESSHFIVKVTRMIDHELVSKIYCDVGEYKVDPVLRLLILEQEDSKTYYINIDTVYEFEAKRIYE